MVMMMMLLLLLLLLLSAEMYGNFVIQVFDPGQRFDQTGHGLFVCLFVTLCLV